MPDSHLGIDFAGGLNLGSKRQITRAVGSLRSGSGVTRPHGRLRYSTGLSVLGRCRIIPRSDSYDVILDTTTVILDTTVRPA